MLVLNKELITFWHDRKHPNI